MEIRCTILEVGAYFLINISDILGLKVKLVNTYYSDIVFINEISKRAIVIQCLKFEALPEVDINITGCDTVWFGS